MAIYRAESGRRVAIIAGVAAVAGLVLGIVVGRVSAPGLGGQLADLRTQIAPIRSSLEVVRTEYPKLLAGGADAGGAPSAMTRIDTTLAAATPTLTLVSPAATTGLAASIKALHGAIDARAPAAEVDAAIDDAAAALDAVLAPDPVPTGS